MLRLSELRAWPARLTAFARSAEPRPALSSTALGLDVLLACVFVIAALAGSSPHRGVFGWGALAAVLMATVPLALRRVCPIAVFWAVLLGVVLVSQATTAGSEDFIIFVALLFAAYSAVVHSRFRGAAVLSVLLAGVVVTAAFTNTDIPQPGRFTALFVLIPVVLVGSAVRRWWHRAGDSQARLQRAEVEHRADTAQALAAERARIAGELHDVVTHNVSVMVVQAGAARRVLTGSPADATTALLAVEASGRAALVELQHLLGLLSPVEGMQQGSDPCELDTVPLQPQPGLRHLPALVNRVAAAGMPVELTVTGPPRSLEPGLDLTAYRVVQEALTNVMKHAGPAAATVRLHYRDDAVVIDVSDDGGRTDRPSRAPSPAGTAPSVVAAGAGRGLLGLRERLSLYGGEFDAGPRPAGGWRVTATLPDAEVAASA